MDAAKGVTLNKDLSLSLYKSEGVCDNVFPALRQLCNVLHNS